MRFRCTIAERAAKDATIARLWNAGEHVGVIAIRTQTRDVARRVEIMRRNGVELAVRFPPKQTTMAWTPERLARIKKLCEEGKSAGEIAKALGGCSRNSVIGHIHRNGWQLRRGPGPLASTTWTPETLERVRAMFMDGKSYAKISAETGVTYHAIKGKAERMGWIAERPAELRERGGGSRKGRTFVRKGSDLPRVPRSGKASRPTLSAITGGMVQPMIRPAKVEIKAGAWLPLEGSTPQTLTNRTGCKWPVGSAGAETLFCDLLVYGDDPCWCARHRQMGRVRAA